MKIKIDKYISNLKSEFCEKYPGLKLEFYQRSHPPYQGSRASDQLPDNTLLSEISSAVTDSIVEVSDEMTVSQLEKVFEDYFGLHVQVYRKSKDIWLQTSSTDDWTLEKQNRKGIHSAQV